MAIKKPVGFTPTEKRLSELCDRTFLKTWAYPNPRQHDRKELCDVIAIFENHVFLFFDRESRKFDNPDSDLDTQWARWEKEAIQKQLRSLVGAKKYILKHPDKVYLDEKSSIHLPVPIPSGNIIIHKIVVANGASQACKNASESNISGSLGIMYVKEAKLETGAPFLLYLINLTLFTFLMGIPWKLS